MPSRWYSGSITGMVTRNVTAPEPSRWTSSASSAVPTTMRGGLLPTARQNAVDDRVEHAGVGHDAEVEDGEDEHPGHGGHALDAVHDERRRSAGRTRRSMRDTTGTAMRAASGVIFLPRMTASKARIVANPRMASMRLCAAPGVLGS